MRWKFWMAAGLLASIAITAFAEEGVTDDRMISSRLIRITRSIVRLGLRPSE